MGGVVGPMILVSALGTNLGFEPGWTGLGLGIGGLDPLSLCPVSIKTFSNKYDIYDKYDIFPLSKISIKTCSESC